MAVCSPLVVVVGPAWAMTWRWESSRNQVAGTEGKRKASVARRALNEAWNEPVSRRTGIGCEALRTGASGPLTAKLPRPMGSGVDPAIVRGRSPFLPGEASPYA